MEGSFRREGWWYSTIRLPSDCAQFQKPGEQKRGQQLTDDESGSDRFNGLSGLCAAKQQQRKTDLAAENRKHMSGDQQKWLPRRFPAIQILQACCADANSDSEVSQA